MHVILCWFSTKKVSLIHDKAIARKKGHQLQSLSVGNDYFLID